MQCPSSAAPQNSTGETGDGYGGVECPGSSMRSPAFLGTGTGSSLPPPHSTLSTTASCLPSAPPSSAQESPLTPGQMPPQGSRCRRGHPRHSFLLLHSSVGTPRLLTRTFFVTSIPSISSPGNKGQNKNPETHSVKAHIPSVIHIPSSNISHMPESRHLKLKSQEFNLCVTCSMCLPHPKEMRAGWVGGLGVGGLGGSGTMCLETTENTKKTLPAQVLMIPLQDSVKVKCGAAGVHGEGPAAFVCSTHAAAAPSSGVQPGL